MGLRAKNSAKGRTQTKPRSREVIRDAALSLFAERGFDATSISEVAKVAGVPKANVLYYFSDKAELWKEAIDHHWAQVDAFYLDNMPPSADPSKQDLKRRLLLYFEACCRFPPYVQIMNLEGHSDTWRNKWLAEHHLKRHIEGAKSIWRAYTDSGLIDANRLIVFQSLFTGGGQLLIGQFQLWIEAAGADPRDPQFREEYAEAVVDHLIK